MGVSRNMHDTPRADEFLKQLIELCKLHNVNLFVTDDCELKIEVVDRVVTNENMDDFEYLWIKGEINKHCVL
jgi:thiamine monophosphate synthase